MRLAVLVGHGLMDVRVEVHAERLDRPDAALAQHVLHLAVNQLHPFAQRILLGRGLQRALEVVDDRQQVLHGVRHGEVGHVAPVAIDALPVVVELCRRPE